MSGVCFTVHGVRTFCGRRGNRGPSTTDRMLVTCLKCLDAIGDDDSVRVFWYDCDCEWITKYCEENHRRSALVPRGVLG